MKAAMFIVDGFEDVEAIGPYDVIKRAGIDVELVSLLDKEEVVSTNGLKIKTDVLFKDAKLDDYFAYILPGGEGYVKYQEVPALEDALLKANNDNKLIAAICAAPSYLAKIGLLNNRQATVFPELASSLESDKIEYIEGELVRCENIITAPAMGWALDFGLEIVAYLKSDDDADKLAIEMDY